MLAQARWRLLVWISSWMWLHLKRPPVPPAPTPNINGMSAIIQTGTCDLIYSNRWSRMMVWNAARAAPNDTLPYLKLSHNPLFLAHFAPGASSASWTPTDISHRANQGKLMTVASKDVLSRKMERMRRGCEGMSPTKSHLVRIDMSQPCQSQFSAQTSSLPCVYSCGCLSPSLLPSDCQLFRLCLATGLPVMFRRGLPSFPASSGAWSKTPLAAPAPPLEPESSGETKTANIFIKLAASERKTQNPVNFNRGENKHPLVLFTESSWWSHNFCTHLLLQLTWITAIRRAETDKLKTNVTESGSEGDFSAFYQALACCLVCFCVCSTGSWCTSWCTTVCST